MCVWRPIAFKLYPSGPQEACKIVPAWPPVAGKFPSILLMLHATGGHAGSICMRLAATRVQFVSHWRPLRYNLHAPGRQSHAIFVSTVQSRKFFESTLPEQLFEFKNEETITKSENLRDICTS